jgi:hypothetical protein
MKLISVILLITVLALAAAQMPAKENERVDGEPRKAPRGNNRRENQSGKNGRFNEPKINNNRPSFDKRRPNPALKPSDGLQNNEAEYFKRSEVNRPEINNPAMPVLPM